MTTFVTGGTGFLGVNLVRQLVDRGVSVRVLVRPDSPRLGLDSERIEFVQGDITDPASLRRAMSGCQNAYHLAGWVQVSPWGWDTARRINVEGTRNFCESALQSGVERVVHTSSIATMAAGTIEAPADEDAPWNIAAERIPYYQTKCEAEAVVQKAIGRGLDAVIVNPTYVVGPWDIKPSAGRLIIHLKQGHVKFYPARGGINYADVRLVAEGHLQAMERGQTGRRYILGGENLSFKDYLTRVAAIVDAPAPWMRMPRGAMVPFAALGSVLGRVAPGWFRDVNLSVLHSACLEHYVSSRRAEQELGFRVATVDAAIRDAVAWFQEHGYMQPSSKKVSG